ncbi:RNA exonuclease [Plectosphaerella cucumerina]|jgi:RNA exonuclease 1|uniref:RNA exonuclease n=1 Tax=Plectosphaerella cucumerina TaxID=40658 RepID=A0A8K0TJ73_9PEZI|nr:RNA exonuclease [Plectosphaerella cucumerina]
MGKSAKKKKEQQLDLEQQDQDLLTADAEAAVEAVVAALRNPNALEDADSLAQLQATASDASAMTQAREALQIQESILPATSTSTSSDQSLKRGAPHDEDGGGWEKIGRNGKKAKKTPNEGSNTYPGIDFSSKAKLFSKINLSQLRDLCLYIFADGTGPQWVSVSNRPQFRKIVVLMIPGLEEAMFTEKVNFETYNSASIRPEDRAITSPDDFYPRLLKTEWLPPVLKPFVSMFTHLWPVKAPGDDKNLRLNSPLNTFLTAPNAKSKEKGVKPAKEPNGWKNERTRITEFLATLDELETNGHLIHPVLLPDEARRAAFKAPEGWVTTRVESLEDAQVPEIYIEQGSVTAGRECLALDCEMCMTGPEEYSLTRISILSWTGEVIMDELVKPAKPITNYLTQFSGITAEMLENVTTSLEDIQARLLDLITPRTILLGHSLESDLKALRLSHPFIVDTSLIFPHPRGPPLKSSLKWLSQKYINREIQKGGAAGHNPVEDARACLDLVRQKCEKGKLWGSSDAQGENLFRRLARAGTSYKAQGAEAGGATTGKTSAAVDWGNPSKGPGAGATHQIGCKNDEEVTQAIIRAVQGDPDGAEIRGGGVDFVWARMRELEAQQGWWNTNRAENANSDGGPPPEAVIDAALLADLEGDNRPPLERCLARLTDRIQRIHAALPKCTAFIIYSGSGDPREMSRLQAMQAKWKKEYHTPGKKWDELSVKWTDVEDQALRTAVKRAREGIGFVSVK